VISSKTFYKILRGRAISTTNNRSPNICWFAVECHLFSLFKGFLTGLAELALPGEEGVGTGAQLPQK